MGPTYMENFIAIPHGKSQAVRQTGVAFGRSSEGIWYETEHGGGLAKLIFLLAIPDQMSPDEYIAVLAHLARLLVHEEFRAALHAAATYEDVFEAVLQGEALLAGVSLRAPHGGLFVIPLANKPLVWLLAIILGGLATAGMLILLKPTLPPEKSGVSVEASENPDAE